MKRYIAILSLAAALAAVVFVSREDLRLLRDWGLLDRVAPRPSGARPPRAPYFEPMGVPYRRALSGFERTFKMEETTDDFVERPQPRFFGLDEESAATLEIRGEKENIGLASLTVYMPRLLLSREAMQTQQAVSFRLMSTFLLNVVPQTYPGGWLNGMVAAYNRGEEISVVKSIAGRKLVIRVDPKMRNRIRLIVVKEQGSSTPARETDRGR